MDRNGSGRKKPTAGGKQKKKSPPKGGKGSRLLLGLITLCNFILTLVLWVMRRQDVVHAIQTDEGVKVLLTREKQTKS